MSNIRAHRYARTTALALGAAFGVASFSSHAQLTVGALSETALTRDMAYEMTEAGLPNTFVPGRNLVFLTLASYVFYGWWDWRFCGLMLGSSVMDWAIGLAIGANDRRVLIYPFDGALAGTTAEDYLNERLREIGLKS